MINCYHLDDYSHTLFIFLESRYFQQSRTQKGARNGTQ
jgi:hypothetical protein